MMALPRVERFSQLTCLVKGQGPALVLLHGGTGSSSHWLRNIDGLAGSFQVFAFDLPGYGRSPAVTGAAATDPESYIDWVAAATKEAARSAAYHLAGFSFGAAVAGGVAARHRGSIATLTLAGPGGFGNAQGRQLDLRPVREGLSPAGRRDVIRHNLLQTMIADPSRIDETTIDIQAENIRNARYDSRRISLQPRLLKDLAQSDAPLQLIWGEQDHLAYPSIEARVELCRSVRPDAEVNVIPSAGHWVQYEQADAFNRVLSDFVSSNSCCERAQRQVS